MKLALLRKFNHLGSMSFFEDYIIEEKSAAEESAEKALSVSRLTVRTSFDNDQSKPQRIASFLQKNQ